MTIETGAPDTGRDDKVRARAYGLWEAAGRPDGEAERHWLQACAEIDGDASVAGVAAGADGPDAAPLQSAPAMPEARNTNGRALPPRQANAPRSALRA